MGDTRPDIDALALRYVNLHVPGFGAVSQESMWMWTAVNVQTYPTVGDDIYVGNVYMFVGLDKVTAENGAE